METKDQIELLKSRDLKFSSNILAEDEALLIIEECKCQFKKETGGIYMKNFVKITLIFNSMVIMFFIFLLSYTKFYENLVLTLVLNGLIIIEMPVFFYYLDKDKNIEKDKEIQK